MSTITKLTAENIKRLRAIEIEPDGSAVIIGGRNAQGKSSVLDSIEAAIGGKSHCPAMPIRDGETKARVVLETEDLRITRQFAKNGDALKTSLVVTSLDGRQFTSPQKVLDKLIGHLSFDPLEFSRMKPAQRAETLRQFVGLDLSRFEQAEKAAYASRTLVGRDLATAKARLEKATRHTDVPTEPVSFKDIALELSTAQNNKAAREQLEIQVMELRDRIEQYQETLDRLTDRLSNIEPVTDADIETINGRLLKAQAINEKIRENEQYGSCQLDVMRARASYDNLTHEIEQARDARAQAVASAEYPIDGLSVTETGVEYNGVPFEQASASEQLRVSVAMGLALNHGLKVLLIRDGSLLDKDALAQVATMAAEAGGQVWIERVSDGNEVSVVIEDGTVQQ